MDEDQHYTHRRRLDRLLEQIQRQFTGQYRLDLLKMYKTIENQYTEMDREFVNCRRKMRLSSDYEYKEEQFNHLFKSMEKRITLALLSQ